MNRLSLLLVLALSGCVASSGAEPSAVEDGVERDTDLPGATDPNAAAIFDKADGVAKLSNDIHWVRNSAEYQALTRQVYRQATTRLEAMLEATPREPGTWAVVLDADETVLDNSQYQKERLGRSSTQSAWHSWVQRREAGAVPGAVAFLERVKELGGVVAIVTNRSTSECADTQANLEELGVEPDAVLCKGRSSNKSSRWNQVEAGTAADGLGPAEILMYVGDNIQDFPSQTQDLRMESDEAFEEFGSSYFVIPNPMYGSWERNTRE